MNDRCLIISGGEQSAIHAKAGDFIIACDKGYQYAAEAGLIPNLFVGDFDSFDGEIASGIPVDKHASEKDDTDTMIAIRYAVEHGFKAVELCCALGGRLDHTLANLQSAVFAAMHGLSVKISGNDSVIYTLTKGEIKLKKLEGYSVSLIAASDECSGVFIRGAKYPLTDATVTNSFPIGVSNEWREGEVSISVGSGIMLIVLSKL